MKPTASGLRSREPGYAVDHKQTLTTTVDHNDIRLRSIESDGGKSNPQVNDSNRHRAGSLQAKDPTVRIKAESLGRTLKQ